GVLDDLAADDTPQPGHDVASQSAAADHHAEHLSFDVLDAMPGHILGSHDQHDSPWGFVANAATRRPPIKPQLCTRSNRACAPQPRESGSLFKSCLNSECLPRCIHNMMSPTLTSIGFPELISRNRS